MSRDQPAADSPDLARLMAGRIGPRWNRPRVAQAGTRVVLASDPVVVGVESSRIPMGVMVVEPLLRRLLRLEVRAVLGVTRMSRDRTKGRQRQERSEN